MFDRDSLIQYLTILGKRTRKQFRDAPIDIWIVGGSNIVYSFDFRDMTADIDIIKSRSIDLRDIALSMEQEFNLPHNWINDSVMFSNSFSLELRKYSGETRTFSHSLVCHFLQPVAIAAMKLRAVRPEKGDLLDALCILADGNIGTEEISSCYKDLYGEDVPSRLLSIIHVLSTYFERYSDVRNSSEVKRLFELYAGDIESMKMFIRNDLL